MLETFLASFGKLLDPQVMLFMMIGIVIGMVVGICPGWFHRDDGADAAVHLQHDAIRGFCLPAGHVFGLRDHGRHHVRTRRSPWRSRLGGIGRGWLRHDEKRRSGPALGAAVFSSAIGALIGAAFLAISIPVIRPAVSCSANRSSLCSAC